MKTKICEYRLVPKGHHFRDPIEVMMPYEAQLLEAKFILEEDRVLRIWASFDADFEKRLVKRVFHVLLTDEEVELPPKVRYFRTLLHPTSFTYYHLFHEAW